jgi:putative nucleotidyltransferase with HDIG domain
MTYEQALRILKGFRVEPGNDWDRHCICVADIACRLALEVRKFTAIDAEKTRVMGLVHDFGRSVTQDPYRHAYEGYKLMKQMGEEELARICVCHSNGTYKLEDLDIYGLKPEDFYAVTPEEKLVFISDSLEFHGDIIRHDKRISGTVERYKTRNPEFIPVLLSKLEEFRVFDKEIKMITGRSVYDILGI